MHKITAFITLLAVTGITFNKAIVLLDYNFNKNFIASALCENRNKPACCCKGKCFLKKQMQKDEGSGKNSLPLSKDKFDISLFCDGNSKYYLIDLTAAKISGDYYLLKKYSNSLSPVFHPPGKA